MRAAIVVSVLAGSGCHDIMDGGFPYVCPSSDRIEALSDRLSETGLYTDLATEETSPGVMSYRPRFELWSDGATKRRWFLLPAGTQIDNSDPDDWVFPEGTRVWKEFSRDGIRVETRLIAKIDAEWLAQAYLWLDDGSDAIAIPEGYVDARGTSHDVPANGECSGCHGGRNSFVLGVSAIQLGYDAIVGDIDLADLVTTNALVVPTSDTIALPGDEVAESALGYLHANCGHCHNSASPERPCLSPDALDFGLRIEDLGSVEATSAYASVADAGDKLIKRMSRTGFSRMPPLGSRVVDDRAIETLRAWMSELP